MRALCLIATALNLASVITLLIVARKWSCHVYDEGHKDGFAKGRQESDNRWIGVERQVGEEREKIWREEA
jgi:hypothetical protein